MGRKLDFFVMQSGTCQPRACLPGTRNCQTSYPRGYIIGYLDAENEIPTPSQIKRRCCDFAELQSPVFYVLSYFKSFEVLRN